MQGWRGLAAPTGYGEKVCHFGCECKSYFSPHLWHFPPELLHEGVTWAMQRNPAEICLVTYPVVLTDAHVCWHILNRQLRISVCPCLYDCRFIALLFASQLLLAYELLIYSRILTANPNDRPCLCPIAYYSVPVNEDLKVILFIL